MGTQTSPQAHQVLVTGMDEKQHRMLAALRMEKLLRTYEGCGSRAQGVPVMIKLAEQDRKIAKLRRAVGEIQSQCFRLQSSSDTLAAEYGALKTGLQALQKRCRLWEAKETNTSQERSVLEIGVQLAKREQGGVGAGLNSGISKGSHWCTDRLCGTEMAAHTCWKLTSQSVVDQRLLPLEDRTHFIYSWIPKPQCFAYQCVSDEDFGAEQASCKISWESTRSMLTQNGSSVRKNEATDTWFSRMDAELAELMYQWERFKVVSKRRPARTRKCGPCGSHCLCIGYSGCQQGQ